MRLTKCREFMWSSPESNLQFSIAKRRVFFMEEKEQQEIQMEDEIR